MKRFTTLLAAIALTLAALAGGDAQAQRNTQLGNICRLKGQEENTLRGIGLVVGLNGTGESNDPATMRALNRALQLMGNPVSATGRFDEEAERALRNVKNAALVMVTATVPAQGSRTGDRLDCTVSAINGKSLVGGRLIAASLLGDTGSDAVYGRCEGPVNIGDPAQPMAGYVHDGCQIVRDVVTPYVSEDGWVTIVLDAHHANFKVAEYITEDITEFYSDYGPNGIPLDENTIRREYVQAINAANIRVKIPLDLARDPVSFVSLLMELPVSEIEPEARVVCDTRTGTIAITGEIAIGSVVFSHRNLTIDTNAGEPFQLLTASETARPRLAKLVQDLSTLRVPPRDQIEIIRNIHKLGKLHARLIVR